MQGSQSEAQWCVQNTPEEEATLYAYNSINNTCIQLTVMINFSLAGVHHF